MGVVLDTSIWVDVERGRLSPNDVAAITGSEPVYLAPPIIAELQYGVDRAPDAASRARRASAKDFTDIPGLDVLAVSSKT